MKSSEDIFPKPGKLIHNIFRCCGSCPRCIAKQSQMESEIEKTNIKMTISGGGGKKWEDVLDEEYILICSAGKPPPIFSQMSSSNPPVYYISNYGRQFMISDGGRGCELCGPPHGGGREGLSPLTQEFINYYNSINFWVFDHLHQHIFRRENSEQMIKEYHKKPNMKISYKIEKDKREIQKMTSELQQKETEIVNQREYLKNIENKLILQEKIFKENEQKLKDQINIHKQKSIKLFEKENKISVKGSIEIILKELIDISFSISEILEITEEPVLLNRINQIIGKLNTIKSTNNPIQVNEDVIVATEVFAEPSAPPPWSSLSDALFSDTGADKDVRLPHDIVRPSLGYRLAGRRPT